jgi:serine/threonine protein kinase
LAEDESSLDVFGWVGATIDSKYRVDRVVGEGGFGVVYRGHHLGFDAPVAIKCLKIPQSIGARDREKFLEAFLAEGRLLHRLSRATAGIVQALDLGAGNSPSGRWTPWLILEWLVGRTLEAEIAERPPRGRARSLDSAVQLLEPAVRAIDVAHGQGVAHRDLKPANLFLADVGGHVTMKVLDLGIAKVMNDTSSTTRLFAETGNALRAFSPQYGAPEQFDARLGATGPWTDVYALALIVVELVAGYPAYRGRELGHLLREALDPQVRPTLRTLGVATSDGVDRVLRRALSVVPRERFVRAGDFWDQLIVATRAANDATTPAPFSPPIAPRAQSTTPRSDGGAAARELPVLHAPHELQTGQGSEQAPVTAPLVVIPALPGPSEPPAGHPPYGGDDDEDEPRRSGLTWFVIVMLLVGAALVGGWFALPYVDPSILRSIGIDPPSKGQ